MTERERMDTAIANERERYACDNGRVRLRLLPGGTIHEVMVEFRASRIEIAGNDSFSANSPGCAAFRDSIRRVFGQSGRSAHA